MFTKRKTRRNTDQSVRDEFERWESVYRQSFGESPAETYMDIENSRYLSETDYYSEPPLPFIYQGADQERRPEQLINVPITTLRI